MFSPEASVQSARGSLRNNPRRRQRKDSDGVQQPRRKRNKISEDTFYSPLDAHVNGNGGAVMNGRLSHGHGDADGSMVLVDMPVREKKAVVKRASKDDAAHYLTKNENYSVKKLPSFPASLSHDSTPFRAFALPSAGLAVALTSSQALAWDYTAPSGTARVTTLPLPFGLKPSEPLPLGAIVRNGPTNEFGVLAVAPSRGKIIFWENVESAEVRNHYAQRPKGIEGSVKLQGGEVIKSLVDIDHAGYILIFSSGRMAQLTLRDSQGRPSIATNTLNAPNSAGKGWLINPIKTFVGSVLPPIASVKARPSEAKGQTEVITVTKTGVFQVWDLSWSGQHMFKGEVDVRAEVLNAFLSSAIAESQDKPEVHVLDFAILNQGQAQDAVALLVLVGLIGRDSIEYSLLEVDLSNYGGVVRKRIPIRNYYQAQIPKELTGELLLPAPGHTAFVQFPDAVVVASLVEPEQGPEAQLHFDSGPPTLPFQDAIYLRHDRNLQFCAYALESSSKKDARSSAILFVQGYGLVQVSALPPATDDEDVGRTRVTAKSKLEQATFFSTNSENILDFSIQSRYTFGQEEVETAALEISTGILSSSYDYFDKVTPSMEEQIRQRQLALRTLITHLQAEYPPVSYATKWHLLWNAEKLEAALALWNVYQESVHNKHARPESFPGAPLVADMVKVTHERFKTKIRPELGETDPVRQFFIKDINTLEILLPWAWQHTRAFYLNDKDYMEDRTPKQPETLQRVSDADDVMLNTLEAAFKFREENIALYGLDPDILDDGVLKPDHGQDLLPEFWTSTHNMVSAVRALSASGRDEAYAAQDVKELEGVTHKIAAENPRLVRLVCQLHIERFEWALAQPNEKRREMGVHLKQEWNNNVRPRQIIGLVDIGQVTEGMNLAEHYKDMHTLAVLVWEEVSYMEGEKDNADTPITLAACNVKLGKIKERVHRYFDKYGVKFAGYFYSQFIEGHRSERLFYKDFMNQPALTKFLRSRADLGRLGWINEVSGEKNYEGAHDMLVGVASQMETSAWSKKVELSIAKLSLMCKYQKGMKAPEDATAKEKLNKKLGQTKGRLEYVKIQDRLHDRFAPIVSGALDEAAAVKLLMEEFGQGRLTERPALQKLLEQGFEQMVKNHALEPALLIDILTLMQYDETKPPTEITQSNEFAFALKALVLSWHDLKKPTRNNLLKLIWKRLCIKDNWPDVNNTKGLSDEEVADMLANTALGWTLKAVCKMTAESSVNKHAQWTQPVAGLLGAGCTNGELCVRFHTEDLRQPIIADNLDDDRLLQEYIEKHRLDQWFGATVKAAQKAFAREQQQLKEEQEETPSGENGEASGQNGVASGENGKVNGEVVEGHDNAEEPGEGPVQTVEENGQDVDMADE